MLNIKEASWKVILLSILVSVGMGILLNLVLVPGSFFDPISNATSKLINVALQANLLHGLMFLLIVLGWGRLRPFDLGWEWEKLAQGLALTGLLWLVTQVVVLLFNGIYGDFHLHPSWHRLGITGMLGSVIGQFAGNAPFEEMQFRGLYLRQFFLKIQNQGERQRWAWALLSMAGLFFLFHIPHRMYEGYRLSDMPVDFIFLFLAAIFFGLIYLISGNLFLAIGTHALMNQPILISDTAFPTVIFIPLFGLLLAALIRARNRTAALINLSPLS